MASLTHRHIKLSSHHSRHIDALVKAGKIERSMDKQAMYELIDAELKTLGFTHRKVMIIPEDTVEVYDWLQMEDQPNIRFVMSKRDGMELSLVDPVEKPRIIRGRKLAPEDTKAGIAQRHAQEMVKVSNHRSRYKRGLELALQTLGIPTEQINRAIDQCREADFDPIVKLVTDHKENNHG